MPSLVFLYAEIVRAWDDRASRKVRPSICVQSGMSFPLEALCGNCNLEFAPRTGRSFPNRALWETAAQNSAK